VDRVCGVHGNNSHKLSTPDVLIARLAARQHGVVTVVQLLAAGLDRDAIAYRRRVGRLHLLHRGVYAVGHRPPSPLAKAMAAVLACGPGAALSHGSAAALWRIVPRWCSPTHVAATSDRRHPSIHIHRSTHADATTHYGIRVTTPARTLVDLADVLNERALTRAVNEAQVLRLVTSAELTTLFTRYPGRAPHHSSPSGAPPPPPPARTSKTTSSASSSTTASRSPSSTNR
jgi:predicted transcriptional regulator of viral defense system